MWVSSRNASKSVKHAVITVAWVMVGACVAPNTHEWILTNREGESQVVMAHRAQRALLGLQLDFRRPMGLPEYDSGQLVKLFFEACLAGDRPSCWIAAAIAEEDVPRALIAVIRRNCLAGDAMSCRAIPIPRLAEAKIGTPGEFGRSPDCGREACPESVLRSECTAGFAWSCHVLTMGFHLPDRVALTKRAVQLAEIGCRAGIMAECRVIRVSEAFGRPYRMAEEQECAIRRNCRDYAMTLLKEGNRDAAVLAYERACQFGYVETDSCIELGNLYLKGELREPVVGRGQALVDWGCAQEAFRKTWPTCKLAHVPLQK